MARKTSKIPAKKKTSRSPEPPMPMVWTPMMLEEEIFEEQRPLYVGKEAGQEAQRAIRAQAAEQAARVAAIRAPKPTRAPVFLPEEELAEFQERERRRKASEPVPTAQPYSWDYLRNVSAILQEADIPPPSSDPETQRELAEYLATPEAQLAVRALDRITSEARLGLDPDPSKRRMTPDERAAIAAFEQRMAEMRTGPTSEELIAAQRRSVAKIKPAQLEQPPKRLQKEVARRMAPIDEFEQGWKAEIARQNRQIRSSRMQPAEAASALEALAEKENDFRIETLKRRMAVQDWWKRQIAEDDKPVYFPEGEEERIIKSGGLTREVKFGKRAEIIERATGVAPRQPKVVEEMVDEATQALRAFLGIYGEKLSDDQATEVGRKLREAAELDIRAELAKITQREEAGKISKENAEKKRDAARAAHQMARERYEQTLGYIRRARERRGLQQSAPITDFDIGVSQPLIGETREATAARFAQELRGLYEYVDLPDPITGRLERTRVPKIDEDGNPIYLGILTKYAGDPSQTGSFMGQKMRVRRSETGAYERAERAELGVERAIEKMRMDKRRRDRDKRAFARLVYQFNNYTDGQIDRGYTRENIDAQRSAPKDEALIKYYIREYGFALPEWSKMPFPKRFRDTPTAVWEAEYGYGAPKRRTKEEGEAIAAERRRLTRLSKTSRPR